MELKRNDHNERVTSFKYQDLLLKEETEIVNIERRIQTDAINIEKVCATYLGSIDTWFPIKPGININNFYLDKDTHLGWCVNPKVSHKTIINVYLLCFKCK